MKKAFVALLAVILGIGALLVVWGMPAYNDLISMNEEIEGSWSQVQVQYQRRYDLIPNLVETVKGVAEFESSTYEAVTAARSAWAEAVKSGSSADQIAAAGVVESALSRLLVTVENYPQLKAQDNFKTLQAQLEGAENRVSVARRDYNNTVLPYNTKIQQVPDVIIARIFDFEEASFFESIEGSEAPPEVDFND